MDGEHPARRRELPDRLQRHRAGEVPKLEAAYAKLGEIPRQGQGQEDRSITLFIAGHTDTVGDGAYNMKLSRERARSIAGWFRKRGTRIPIAFEGFGETALAVSTADGVDEPRNRRVDYILSMDEPTMTTSGFRPAWKRDQVKSRRGQGAASASLALLVALAALRQRAAAAESPSRWCCRRAASAAPIASPARSMINSRSRSRA